MSSEVAAKVGGAIVSVTAHVPEDAMSAGLLGTERVGHGVRIRDDGLIATIGYVVHEAENLWIGTRDTVVPGFVVGYDYESGFGLVKPSMPLQGPVATMGSADALAVGDPVNVVGSRGTRVHEARVVAKQEFAGRWEYLLDEAIFTAPAGEDWSGAGLFDSQGRLAGLGFLLVVGAAALAAAALAADRIRPRLLARFA